MTFTHTSAVGTPVAATASVPGSRGRDRSRGVPGRIRRLPTPRRHLAQPDQLAACLC
jgi:hypothetical protein